MKTKEELKKELEDRHLIHHKASLFFSDSKYLNKPGSEEEKKLADRNNIVRRTRYSFWVITVFELCKLFGSKREAYSIQKLFNKLLHNYSGSEWNDSLSKEDIHQMTERLNSNEIQKIIKQLKGLRDEYYGHLDRNPKRPIDDYTPYFEDVEKLFEFSEETLTSIYKKVFNAKSIFRDIENSQAGNFLKLITGKRF